MKSAFALPAWFHDRPAHKGFPEPEGIPWQIRETIMANKHHRQTMERELADERRNMEILHRDLQRETTRADRLEASWDTAEEQRQKGILEIDRLKASMAEALAEVGRLKAEFRAMLAAPKLPPMDPDEFRAALAKPPLPALIDIRPRRHPWTAETMAQEAAMMPTPAAPERKKPPLGLTPEYIWQEQRLTAIYDAMKRRIEYLQECPDEAPAMPPEWAMEANRISQALKARRMGKAP